MALIVYAHPYPDRSRANRVLLEAISDLPNVRLHSLYDLYPDFGIDVQREQAELKRHELVVWQHPMYWYSVPGLLKHWFDKVLARGWAYGAGGTALHGKQCWWVTTTGGDDNAFTAQGMHAFGFDSFTPPIEQTARFCGMSWHEPLVLKGAHRVSAQTLADTARLYRERLLELLQTEKPSTVAATGAQAALNTAGEAT